VGRKANQTQGEGSEGKRTNQNRMDSALHQSEKKKKDYGEGGTRPVLESQGTDPKKTPARTRVGCYGRGAGRTRKRMGGAKQTTDIWETLWDDLGVGDLGRKNLTKGKDMTGTFVKKEAGSLA